MDTLVYIWYFILLQALEWPIYIPGSSARGYSEPIEQAAPAQCMAPINGGPESICYIWKGAKTGSWHGIGREQ